MNTRFIILLLIAGLIAAQQLSSQKRTLQQEAVWAQAETRTFSCKDYGALEIRTLADSARLQLFYQDQLVFQARLPRVEEAPAIHFGNENIDYQQYGATVSLMVDGQLLFETCPVSAL